MSTQATDTNERLYSDQRSTPTHAPAAQPSRVRETKLFAKTSEFWAMLAGIIAVGAVYNVASDESLNLWRAALLATVIAVAYIVSRGLAKVGSHDRDRTTGSSY